MGVQCSPGTLVSANLCLLVVSLLIDAENLALRNCEKFFYPRFVSSSFVKKSWDAFFCLPGKLSCNDIVRIEWNDLKIKFFDE